MRLRLTTLFSLFCLNSLAAAAYLVFPEGEKSLQGDVKSGYEAYKLDDFPKAMKLFMGAAIKGDKNAQFAVGRMFFEGRGVERSLSSAEEWYRKAADQGQAAAQFNLALLLVTDPARSTEGLDLLKKSATAGNSEAQMTIGELYLRGNGVTQDFATAKGWFEKAAAQGEGGAYFALGQMYEGAVGVSKDTKKALDNYESGAKRDHMPCLLRLAAIYSNGIEGVEKNTDKAKEWLKMGADKETTSTVCTLNLGLLYEVVENKLDEAAKYYKLAAEKGDATAQTKLGIMYTEGKGVEAKDAKKAFEWFEKAAKAGAPAAMYSVANSYEKGEGTAANPKEAVKYLTAAGVGGFGPAMRDLGVRYRDGKGVMKDLLVANTWLQKALNAGDVQAAMILSEMLEKGQDAPRDLKTANALLSQVASLGVAEAQVKLAENTASGVGTPPDLIRSYALLLAAGEFEPAKKKREEMAKKMTKEQLAEAQKEYDRIKAKPPTAPSMDAAKPAAAPR